MSISSRLGSLYRWITEAYQNNRALFIVRTLSLVSLAYVLIFWRALWTPDILFVMLLGLFFIYGKGKQFVTQFGPFLFLLVAYDSLRSFAPYVSKHVHFMEMVDFDKWLFGGTLPTITLQQWLYHGHIQWYDFYFYLLYMCHFLFPVIVALIIWRFRPFYFNRYVAAFLIMSYAGFLTYLLFPAAPPWMASEMGLIPHLHKISTDVWWSVGIHDYPSIYHKLSPNLTAAVPSLHAAYPTMITLFIGRAFGWRWALALLWYPLSIWFGIVYMGEHYVVDALLGIMYAVGAFFLSMFLFRRYGSSVRKLQTRVTTKVAGRYRRARGSTPTAVSSKLR